MINVQGAPAIYQSEVGVLKKLPGFLESNGFQRVFIVHGTKSLHSVKSHIPDFGSLQVHYEHYGGECSDEEINRLRKVAESWDADIIIGLGGGKVLDLSKALGYEMRLEVILIPTVASTCAAWTPLSVFYTENGQFDRYTIFPKSTLLVLVEPEILLKAPIQFYKAGIGDTLAKWYEAKSLIYDLDPVPVAVKIGLQSADLCKNIILEEGIEALTDIEKGKLTSSFRAVTDAIIMLGGMVGGFADHFGRIAGAHSVHNALTKIPSTHHLLHGEKVAYGILVQLALEGKVEEIGNLTAFFDRTGLPKSLIELGISIKDRQTLETIAEHTLLPSESIHFMKRKFESTDILQAFEVIEKINVKRERTG
ncbi:iron-containing alcohol dehydrogenase family protein [Bacillus tianshenii]|uniref:iron-containing alcohol dehydrogenase family protein n=1 Tax=Sutcliffiella tianshenii TaxID=1463404 RepID=UPI001CD19CD8|nr:iron-containing alcohol dehydrogenase family protein [Bacillus tianshenii]MCA1319493.1 iron-containing alcohol dehydrogenase family protein [Bacillus tianshenii]